jgi:hypothetical protein
VHIHNCDWQRRDTPNVWHPEVNMLVRKVVAPIAPASKETERAEEGLFLRLEELARGQPFLLDCAVQQIGEAFVVVLSDHLSGEEACAWTGQADGIVVEFEAWLDRRFPPGSAHSVPQPAGWTFV